MSQATQASHTSERIKQGSAPQCRPKRRGATDHHPESFSRALFLAETATVLRPASVHCRTLKYWSDTLKFSGIRHSLEVDCGIADARHGSPWLRSAPCTNLRWHDGALRLPANWCVSNHQSDLLAIPTIQHRKRTVLLQCTTK